MAFNFKEYPDDILFVPLGGSNEIGMNLNLYHYQGKWLVVDFGIGFANDYLPGVDVLVPDISFIEDKKDDIVGIVLTHAHEDHLGALPYLWEELPCPVYATPFTANVLKNKLKREKMKAPAAINEVQPASTLNLDPFKLEMIELTHSIPEMQAIAIHTEKGTIMHTGDWKLDPEPLIGATTNETRLTHHGDEGVLAIVCDSTNVFVEGESGSEAGVREELTKAIMACEERVVVTTFASNLARLESIIKAGEKAGRKIVVAGGSIDKMVNAAQDSGYLKDIPELFTDKSFADIPRKECMVICTGCQGEPRAALTRMARSEHPKIRLVPRDTVIFSSRDIPGNESRIGYTQNLLVEMGVDIITPSKRDIHVSGHPARNELARMYEMVRPAIAVPVHGEPRHIHEHAKLAKTLGVPETVEPANGAVVLLAKGEAQQVGTVQSGYVAVDGKSLIETSSDIFGKRRRMRDDGIVFISLAMEAGKIIGKPDIQAPGCLDPKMDADLFEEIEEAVMDAMELEGKKKPEHRIRQYVRKILKRELGKRPLLEIAFLEV